RISPRLRRHPAPGLRGPRSGATPASARPWRTPPRRRSGRACRPPRPGRTRRKGRPPPRATPTTSARRPRRRAAPRRPTSGPVAQAWLVLQLTDSPFKLGLISTLQFSPILMFSLVAGAVADRLPKRGLLVTTQTTLACQALLLGVLVSTGRVQYGHVAVLGLVLGFANAVDQPARQSFVMDIVGKGDVANAVALNSAAFNAARIVGPAVAGVLIGRV